MKISLLLLIAPAFLATAAEPKKEKPFTPGGIYRQGDMQRPRPTVIKPPPATTQSGLAQPPSDAVFLFDGKNLSKFKRLPRKGDSDASDNPKWKIENGYAEIAPKSGSIETRAKFGSSQFISSGLPLPR